MSGFRLGEPSKQRGGWVVVVLAQARAHRLNEIFEFWTIT